MKYLFIMKVCVIYNRGKENLAKDFFYKSLNMLINSGERVLKNIATADEIFSAHFSNGDHLTVQTKERKEKSLIKYHSIIYLN